jgi:hypothetical protein
MYRILLAIVLILAGTCLASAAPKLADETNMTYEPDHGTQVEYLKPDGTSFLWYPRTTTIFHRHWKTDGDQVCFRYDAHEYDSATKTFWDQWKCEAVSQYARKLVDQASGDPFGFSHTGNVVFELQPNRTSIAALLKQWAAPPSRPKFSQQTCDAIVANAEKSRSAMIEAAQLYYHGTYMGRHCVTVDYRRTFDLLRRAGDARGFVSLERDLRDRAAGGNPLAISALKQIGPPPEH